MGRVGLIAAAVALSLVAVGAFFWSDIARLAGGSAEGKLVAQVVERGRGGGYAVTFSGDDAKKWYVAPGHRLERFSLDGGETVFVRLVSTIALDGATFEWHTQGLSVQIPVDFAKRSNGKPIEIGVVARAATGRARAPLTVVYSTRQGGNSGWQQLEAGGQFELKTLSYVVPKREEYTARPVLVINADPTGNGGGIELLGV